MRYQVFFSIEAIGRVVTSESPEYCSDATVYSELFASLKVSGDFFGLIDSNGACLQVMYEPEIDLYWFEVPRPDKGGSFGKYHTFDAAVEALKTLPETFPSKGLNEFEFNEW